MKNKIQKCLDYKGKNIWIIGASTGIGASLAHELHNRGANLILSARREEILSALNEKLDGKHRVLPVDVVNAKAVNEAALCLEDLDMALFMAATYEPGLIENIDIHNANTMVDVNFKGALNFIKAVYPIMISKRQGLIALCGSVAGYCGLPNSQPYSATKAAIINLAESLKTEAQEHCIDVKLISPGFVKTPMTSKNDFNMPMIIEPEEAAVIIADGLLSYRFEIHFPRKFTIIIKILSALPYAAFFIISRAILKKKQTNNHKARTKNPRNCN